MAEALISPQVLRWARERSQFSVAGLADKLPTKQEKVDLWEKGEAHPTFTQAQRLAQVLHVPFGYLFLSSPPEEKPAIPDLRTVGDVEQQAISPEFHDLLNDVLRKQQWYREYLLEEGKVELPFIGKFGLNNNPGQVADDIRATMRINETFRRQAVNWEGFLRNFISRAETAGILVLRNGVVGNNTHRKLSVSEFRGFAISDGFAPLIFINGLDAKAAQIFTLAHELAHLWIGESGISNQNLGDPVQNNNQVIERFCNQVAAELLVPQTLFLQEWQHNQTIDENIYQHVRKFRVSSLVILRRALELKLINWDEFIEQYNEELRRAKERERPRGGEGGGDFYATPRTRNSGTLIRAIVSSAQEGRLLYRDAASLLALKKVKTLESIAAELRLE